MNLKKMATCAAVLASFALFTQSEKVMAATNNVAETGVLTVKYNGLGGVTLLDSDGNYQAQVLGKNTTWRYFEKATINGRTMYRLGSDKQWIPAEFTSLNGQSSSQSTTTSTPIESKPQAPQTSQTVSAPSDEKATSGVLYVVYKGLGNVALLDGQGNYQNQYVANGTGWRYFAEATINGRKMYRLGSQKQWIPAEFTNLNGKSASENKPAAVNKPQTSQTSTAPSDEKSVSGVLHVVYKGLGGVALLDSQGNYQNQYLTNGTGWRYFAKATINGRTMYRLGSQKQWIPAEFTDVKDVEVTKTESNSSSKASDAKPSEASSSQKSDSKQTESSSKETTTSALTEFTSANGILDVNYSGLGGVALLDSQGNYQSQHVANGTGWRYNAKGKINGRLMYRIGSDKQWIPAEFVTIDKDADLPNYSRTTGILYVNYQGLGGVNLLDSQGNYQNQYVTNGSSWRYFAKATINGREMYKLGGDKQWIPAEFTAGFQNKSGYYQVQYNQIQPSIYAPGYNLGYNYEGVKTWLVMRRLGTYAGYANYNWATVNAVKNFQASHGLNPTGIVDLATWLKLGFIKETWYGIDSYIAPLGAGKNASREDHINAMINQAYKYLGKPYIVGASSSPDYGVDCSGLVLQALYAGGLNPTSISSTQHAHPGNEWNSRVLWADPKLMTVPLSDIQRGDLVFYYEPGTRTIWHVALYIGNGQVIESWPPRVGISTLRDYNRSIIAGVKRPFI